MKLKQNYDYCIIRDTNEVILYDSNVNFNVKVLGDTCLINTKVDINSDGKLQIQGEELNWNCATTRTDITTLDDKPIDKYINHSKGCKWLGIKPYDYVVGWYIITKRKKVMYLLSNYNIKVIEE